MRILTISDIHSAVEKIPKILQTQPEADLVLIVGDITQRGGKTQARMVIEPLADHGLPLLAVPGNMDTESVLEYLQEQDISIHGRGRIVNGIGFFGVGGSNSTPFHSPFELSDEEITGCLEAGFKMIADCESAVLVSHVPPHGTRLDKNIIGIHCGSKIVKNYIKMKALTLCVCGHIHESYNQETIGSTLCVNVGAVKDNNYCIIEVKQGAVTIDRRKLS
jgi:Icc-related predicted phosphoesterase